MALRSALTTVPRELGPALVLLAILCLAFGLRVYRLGQQNIWWDEGHAIGAARRSLAEVTEITAYDVHPPLYLWLLHGWLRLVGDSEFAVRYLSVIGGTATVALCYVVARRLVGRRAALLATLLMATSRFHIWWSQEARMYVWATFFVLLSTYFMIRLLYGGHLDWWLYVLSSTAALYTLYLSGLALLVHNVFVALTWWRRPRRRRFLFNWVLGQLGIAVLYAPWVFVALSRTRTDVAKTPFPFRLVWQLYGTVLATGISTHLDRYVWLVVPILLVSLAGIVTMLVDRRQPQRYGFAGWEVGLLLALPLVLPPLVVFGLSVPRGVFYSPKPEARYLLVFSPLFYVLLAGTLALFWQKGRWGQVLAVAATLLVFGTFVSVLPAHYAGRYLRDEFQTAMATMAAYSEPGDAVLLVSGDRYPVFLYYYDRQFAASEGPQVYLLPQSSTRFTVENVDGELASLTEQHARLWLASMESMMQDPENLVRQWLDDRFTPLLHVAQGHNSLRLYASEDDDATVSPSFQPQHALDAAHGGDVLVGYDLPTREYRPGDVVNLGLYVRPGKESLALAVDWVAQDGEVVARQSLAVPASAGVVRSIAPFAVYTYTVPGSYSAEVYPAESDSARVQIPAGQVTHSRRLPQADIQGGQSLGLDDGRIRFWGYRLEPGVEMRPGDQLTLDLFWQAEEVLAEDYTVFVHLLGPYNPETGGPLWAQNDSYPLAGGHPTTRWLPGQVVVDRHRLEIPANTPPGTYQIEAGLYDARTGERLRVSDVDQDRILIDEIYIKTD
jgi:4-amino-4-deoxy-L-arabinose transferase-like glycosyltransferase